MTHISELVAEARTGARHWTDCSPEQALVYSCETIAVREHPGRTLDQVQTRALATEICLGEDIDVPFIHFDTSSRGSGGRSRCLAWTDRSGHRIGFIGTHTDVPTVVHEIAHLVSHDDLHDARFRDLLVRLARPHAGIQYAALLHSLFTGVGLAVPQWSPRPAPLDGCAEPHPW